MVTQRIGGQNRYGGNRGQVSGECPNCHNRTALQLREERRVWPELTDNLAAPSHAYVMERAWVCTFCHRGMITLLRYEAGDSQDREPVEVIQVWPPQEPRNLDPVVPEGVSSLFVEASRAEAAGALRGAAGLYRAAVETLCKERGADGRNLEKRIDALGALGLPDQVVADLHEARLLGNWSLHDGLEFSADEVADVAALIAEACHVLYVQPAERAALREKRKNRRDAAAGKDPGSRQVDEGGSDVDA